MQTLSAAGTVSLTTDVTYLAKAISSPSVPVTIAMPDGTYRRQIKRIIVEGDMLLTTETFNLSGTFAGLTSLTFNGVGFNAVLEWDGFKWHMIGGNAVTNP